MMSSQWLHVSVQPLPVAWSHGDVTCKSFIYRFSLANSPYTQPIQSLSHFQDLQPPSSYSLNLIHDIIEMSQVEHLGPWILLSSRKVKKNLSLTLVIQTSIFVVFIWKSSWRQGIILFTWVAELNLFHFESKRREEKEFSTSLFFF